VIAGLICIVLSGRTALKPKEKALPYVEGPLNF
jgi:hypothetical protein